MVLLAQTAKQIPKNLWIVVIMVAVSFSIEIIYRQFTNREINLNHEDK